jgi:PKD repeat protein
VTYTATTSDFDLGDVVTVKWSFDDGASAGGDQVTHSFATAGLHSATATATDSAGVTTVSESLSVTVTKKPELVIPPDLAQPDITPPDTIGLKGPKKVKRGRPAVFTFSSSEPGGGFTCRVDSKPPKTCASPFKLKTRKLGAGKKHTFSVFAVDLAGNADPSPLNRAFRVRR